MTTPGDGAPGASPAGITLDDLWLEFGDRCDITLITGGYRALIRNANGQTPTALYGRIPGELAESINAGRSTRMSSVPAASLRCRFHRIPIQRRPRPVGALRP